MENLTAKVNQFIRSIDFEPDGSLFIALQKEFEITLPEGEIKKLPYDTERLKLEIDDPRTEEIMGFFAPAVRGYWEYLKTGGQQ